MCDIVVPVAMVVRMDDVLVEDYVAAADASSAPQSRQDTAAVRMTQYCSAAGGRSFALQAGLHQSQRHQDPVGQRDSLHI